MIHQYSYSHTPWLGLLRPVEIQFLTPRGIQFWGFPCGSAGKESFCNVGDLGSIPGLGRFPGEGKGYPLQYSGLENPMDIGAWQATVLGVTKSWTQLSDFHFHTASQHWISWVAQLGLIFCTQLQALSAMGVGLAGDSICEISMEHLL